MTAHTTDAQHDCADRGCLATMLGLDLGHDAGTQHPDAVHVD
jgi:hypothetical protein